MATKPAATEADLLRLTGGNVRAPDVSFVSADRLPQVPKGYVPIAPDLAVEILSPEDRPRYMYRSLTDVREMTIDDTLDGEGVLPGFRCTLRDVLA